MMESTKRKNRQTGTYGQSCILCYKAKCRCVPLPGEPKCERCNRLDKDCQPSSLTRRQHTHKEDNESTKRIAHLEKQIANLHSAFQSLSKNDSSSSSSFAPHESISNSDTYSIDDETRFEYFRTQMLPNFPIISFQEPVTALQLSRTHPTLHLSILTITTFSTTQRQRFIIRFKSLISRITIAEARSTLDILQGLLVYLAWSTDLFLGQADLVSRLMMLAISVAQDLKSVRATNSEVRMVMTMVQGGKVYDDSEENRSGGTITVDLNKYRALLACFILSLDTAITLGRQDALQWTHQMEVAVGLLESDRSSPGDQTLVYLVRLYTVKNEAYCVQRQRDAELAGNRSVSAPSTMPTFMYLKSLQTKLDGLSLPPESLPAAQRPVMSMYKHNTALYINQLTNSLTWGSPYDLSSGHPVITPLAPHTNNSSPSNITRLRTLWSCLENIAASHESFLPIPPSTLSTLPSSFWSQLITSITLLKYLSTLIDPDWDCQLVRQRLNLVVVIDDVLAKLELASQEEVLQGVDDHLLTFLAKLMVKCRAWAEMWMKLPGEMDGGDASSIAHGAFYLPDPSQMTFFSAMDLENDEWLNELLGMPLVAQ